MGDLGDVEGTRLHGQLAALDPRQVEDVLDQAQQALGLGAEPGHKLARLLPRQLAFMIVQQLGVGDHAGQRGLQLMARRAQEDVLHAVQVRQLLVVGLELARAAAHAFHDLGAVDDRGDVFREHPQHIQMMFAERLGVVDAIHVEHADHALADRERQRQGRRDATVFLVVLAQLAGRRLLAQRHRLATQCDPARDALADLLARTARELGLKAVRRAGHEIAALWLQDHDAGLLRLERAHDPAHDDLQDDVAPELQLERRADLEQGGQFGQPRAGVGAVALLARQRHHGAV